MSEFLKGNYKAPELKTTPETQAANTKADDLRSEFEKRAMEKLGGSIAFVLKPKGAFVWEDTSAPKK
ncbi:MAG: hypothetical protein HYV14_16950 [Elusimicrobia bacterium]|nr:hypothetical protein [Elusimicrobiota bacterium]